MRASMLIGALIILIFGIIFTASVIGALIGIPLIILSIIFLILGIVLPSKRTHLVVVERAEKKKPRKKAKKKS